MEEVTGVNRGVSKAELGKAEPSMTKQQAQFTNPKVSGFSLYKELSVGDGTWISLLGYELSMLLFNNLPGIVGYGSRAFLYPYLFKNCGKRPGIGRGLILRQPNKITLGKGVLIDDFATLDVRGDGGSITLGDHVTVGRFTTVVSKDANIVLGNGVNVGSYARIASQSKVEIGESTLIAAYAYIGPGNHQLGDDSKPMIEKDMEVKGGVKIGAHAWIGARATILDGVTIGARAIIGAHSLVKDDVPDGAIAVGSPAKIIKKI